MRCQTPGPGVTETVRQPCVAGGTCNPALWRHTGGRLWSVYGVLVKSGRYSETLSQIKQTTKKHKTEGVSHHVASGY